MKEMLGSPTDTSCTTTIGTAATSHVMSSSSSPVSQTNMQPIVSPSNATPISNGTSMPPVSSQNSPPQSIVSPREFFFTLNTEREGELQLHSHYQFLLFFFGCHHLCSIHWIRLEKCKSDGQRKREGSHGEHSDEPKVGGEREVRVGREKERVVRMEGSDQGGKED